MNIYNTQIGFGNEVPNKISLNIYFSGCKNNKKCERSLCQNKHLHDFNVGSFYKSFFKDIEEILNKGFIDCICFLGGEPIDQNSICLSDLCYFIKKINNTINFYSYTGYTIQDNKDQIMNFINQFDITDIFVGEYLLESNNQYWLNNSFS